MPVHDSLRERLASRHSARLAEISGGTTASTASTASEANKPKYGAEIFAGTDYPQTWDGLVGQTGAVKHLQATIASAEYRSVVEDDVRLDHIMLASGLHGIGKTTIAQIIASEFGVGLTCVSGALSVDDARDVLSQMGNGDILFWDEIHLAVAGNRNRADWILPLLTDGVLLTKNGREEMPDITVVAATTDVGKLNNTITSRFMVNPRLVPYTDDEGCQLVENLAARMAVTVHPDDVRPIAVAASNNPRAIRVILTAYRDAAVITTRPDLPLVFEWAGVTADGLSQVAVDMLLVLLDSADHTASIDSIGAKLGEPGPLRHSEQALLQRGLLDVTGRGRKLSTLGVERAITALTERD